MAGTIIYAHEYYNFSKLFISTRSLNTIVQDLSHAYTRICKGQLDPSSIFDSPLLPYSLYASTEPTRVRSVIDKSRSYWAQRLKPVANGSRSTLINLDKNLEGSAVRRLERSVDPVVTRQLLELARAKGVTVGSILHAGNTISR